MTKKMQATQQVAMGGWHIKPGEIYYISEIVGQGFGKNRRYRLSRTKSRNGVCATVSQGVVDTMIEIA